MFRLASRIGAAALLSVLAVVAGRTALATTGVRPEGDGPLFAHAIQFRSSLGLAADLDSVRASYANGRTYSSREFGVPLTVEERDDVSDRIKIQVETDAAVGAALKISGYAGHYFDQDDLGKPVFLFTDPSSPLVDAVRLALPEGTPHELRKARWTYAELVTMKEEVKEAVESLKTDSLEQTSVGIDVVANRVYVGLAAYETSKAEALNRAYPNQLVIEAIEPSETNSCTSMNYCWPMKGGLRIYQLDLSSHPKCTSGFLGRRNDTNAMVIVTAGHCLEINGDGVNDDWGHALTPTGADNFGGELGRTWFENANADIGLIQLNSTASSAVGSNRNLLLVDEPGVVDSVTSIKPYLYQTAGMIVCRIGWGTGYGGDPPSNDPRTCGLIETHFNEDRDSCNPQHTICWNIHHTWKVDFDSVGGDSGGPIYQLVVAEPNTYAIAFGTHVDSEIGSNADEGWYSPINFGIQAYDELPASYTYRVCTTTSCP